MAVLPCEVKKNRAGPRFAACGGFVVVHEAETTEEANAAAAKNWRRVMLHFMGILFPFTGVLVILNEVKDLAPGRTPAQAQDPSLRSG